MGYSVEQMMQGFVDNRGNNITSVSNKVLCNDGTYDITNGAVAPCINKGGQKQINPIEGGQAFLDRQNELAKQQAVMVELGAYNNSLTDKVFGKEGGWSFERPIKLGAYIIIGAVVGRYVAKNMKKSTTLGMVVGGLAPLLALKLTMEYDKKNMPKQEPKQKVALISDKEKIALFEKAINSWKGGVAPPPSWEEINRKEVDLAKAKIKDYKLENEFSTWLNSRTKVDYGMYPPPAMPNKSKPFGNPMPLCQNGTKKVTVPCLVAPCPEMVVCA